MSLFFSLAAMGLKPKVTVSGETAINDTNTSPTNSFAGVRANSDGTLDKRVGSTRTQIDSATDWLIPVGSAPSLYQIKCTDTAGNLDAGSATIGDWITLSSNREWYVAVTSPGSKNFNLTLEIRYNGGATLDSAAFTGNATVDP